MKKIYITLFIILFGFFYGIHWLLKQADPIVQTHLNNEAVNGGMVEAATSRAYRDMDRPITVFFCSLAAFLIVWWLPRLLRPKKRKNPKGWDSV